MSGCFYVATNEICTKCNIDTDVESSFRFFRFSVRFELTMTDSSFHYCKLNVYQVQCHDTNRNQLIRLGKILTNNDWSFFTPL